MSGLHVTGMPEDRVAAAAAESPEAPAGTVLAPTAPGPGEQPMWATVAELERDFSRATQLDP